MKHPPYANPAPLLDEIFDLFFLPEAAKKELKDCFSLHGTPSSVEDEPDSDSDIQYEMELPEDHPRLEDWR